VYISKKIIMVLKIGSTGEHVKQLQKFLNVKDDGIFGSGTELKVRAWQLTHGLTPDGIVGTDTMTKMGYITTDLSEKTESSLEIKRLHLPTGEYLAGPTKKEWLFLHHTAGWHDPFNTITQWGKDTRGPVATEFVLGGQSIKGDEVKSDGVIVQSFPRSGYAWHLGTGNNVMHKNSIGIEVCNFGQLTKGGYKKDGRWIALKPNSFYTYVGVEAAPEQVIRLSKAFRGYEFWHRYSNKQIENLKKLILFIGERDGIDVRKGLPELIRSAGAYKAFDTCDETMCAKTKGLWTHTNVQKRKVDMFPQQELIDMLVSY
jgi:hypothetical protein